MAQGFSKWLDVFLEEKGVDLEEQVEVKKPDGSVGYMPLGFITEHMKAGKSLHKPLKDKFVYLDFKNAPIVPFIAHCGQALWGEYDKYIAVV